MPAEFIYTTYKLARHYPPDRTVLEDISISFYPGAKIGVIGSNGAGKSSLLRIMAGLDDGFVGEARLTPGFTVGYLSQEPQLDPTKDVKGNVMDGVAEVQALLDQYNAVMAKWSDPDADYEAIGTEQSTLEDRINAADAWNVERNVDIAMEALRCPPDDADVSTISGGEKRRVALARLLLQHPDLLLLDEPTNHLDAESVEWLERFLDEYSGTVVAVTHDRYFLDNVAKWILELDRGRGIPFSGNYSGWLEQKLERMAHEQKHADARARTLARELEWVRMGAKARQAKGKARLTAYEQLLAESNDAGRTERELEIAIPPGPRLGDRVIDVTGLRKGYGDRLLVEDLTFSLPRSGIVGIIGPNGAGKTTLFRMLVGEEEPDRGTIDVGDTVVMSYVDQSRDALRDDLTVFQEITDNVEAIKVGNREVPARAYVSSFNFRGSDHQKLVGTLSGGERNRVHLAKLLQTGGNVVLLDEPTNDLDVDTLRALEAGLELIPGLRRRHQPRPLVPRPDRHPHPRVRGRQPGPLLPGQRERLRGVPAQGARRRRRAAAPDQVQAARGLTAGCRSPIATSGPSWPRSISDRMAGLLEAPPASLEGGPLALVERQQERGLVERLHEPELSTGRGNALVDRRDDHRVDPVFEVLGRELDVLTVDREANRDRPGLRLPRFLDLIGLKRAGRHRGPFLQHRGIDVAPVPDIGFEIPPPHSGPVEGCDEQLEKRLALGDLLSPLLDQRGFQLLAELLLRHALLVREQADVAQRGRAFGDGLVLRERQRAGVV